MHDYTVKMYTNCKTKMTWSVINVCNVEMNWFKLTCGVMGHADYNGSITLDVCLAFKDVIRG